MRFSLETYVVNLKQVSRYYNDALAANDDVMAGKWYDERTRIIAIIREMQDAASE
ncbi:MAG: hypothetical protein GY876_10540 [Planctomycetes bacterium]|nr:hypothetical protein [Planctomycetota bacterium]